MTRKKTDKEKEASEPVGRPPLFKTNDEYKAAIDNYMNNIPTKRVFIHGMPQKIPVPTISGLAYSLGFESRQSFYDYEKKPEFSYTTKRARLFIENEYEIQLQTGNTTGAIFALKNMGWHDKQEVETVNKNIDIPVTKWAEDDEEEND